MGDSPPPSGLEAMLLANRPKLLGFFTSRTRDPAEAEDIVQELYLRLARVPPGPVTEPMAYLYRMGLNLVVDRARERQRRARREGDWGEVSTHRIGTELVDDSPSPLAELVGRERGQRIADALASMPPGAARAFRMHKIDGLSHREVAEQLGISRKGVEKHMAVAFRHLAKELQE
jgi:RNA polymerase sigma-70 factor (ECF subfamily)